MYNVATLCNTLLGGPWKVGHPLTRQGQDGGAAIPLLVDASVVLYCHLHMAKHLSIFARTVLLHTSVII